MTPDAAHALHHRITRAGGWIMWLVSLEVTEHPGRAVAWAMVADHSGGTRQPGELVADTLEELRAMLPHGLRYGGPPIFAWPGVAETWD